MGSQAHKLEVYGKRIEECAVLWARLGASRFRTSTLDAEESGEMRYRRYGNFFPILVLYQWEQI
jgi:hypothetical protein